MVIKGKVLFNNTGIPHHNVINTTTGVAAITDDNGEFKILVKEGDQLVFTAINFQLKIVYISPEIVKNGKLIVEVSEKVRALDEVVVSPDNKEQFLQLKDEDFKAYEYAVDRSAAVENIAQPRIVRGMRDGLNVANLFKALFTAHKEEGRERAPLKVSEVLRQLYDDRFFVVDLKLPSNNIDDFLQYCDTKIPSQTLLRKENEFQLIDFLVTQSKAYLKTLKEE